MPNLDALIGSDELYESMTMWLEIADDLLKQRNLALFSFTQ